MSFLNLIRSLKQGDLLIPKLKQWLAKQYTLEEDGQISRDQNLERDAKLSIMTFKRRIEEFNHKDNIKGEYFHPSSLGACLRRTWLRWFKAPKNDDAEDFDSLWRSYMIFETGTYVGIMFQNLCSMAGCLIQREVPIKDSKLRIIGHADGMLKIDNVKYVLEIKTINSGSFAKVKKAGKPEEGHRLQIMAYMGALRVHQGIIVYLEKDRHSVLEFRVNFDQKFFDRNVARRIAVYFDHVRKKTPPPMEGDSTTSAACRWCRFTHLCYSDTGMLRFMEKVKNNETKSKTKKQ